MRLVIQRVRYASVKVDSRVVGAIEKGLLVLLGIGQEETEQDIDWLVKKLVQLRIFNDAEGKMNLSIQEVGGDILVVSQFTLYADCKKGNRPSFTRSAAPAVAIPLYHQFLQKLRSNFSGKVETGEFGAMMQVELLNDGPVTIILDSKNPQF
ncbi:MAG: D-aminoacyl-tRNA deacylase [Bacteroidia bacterium]|nr:D-aminoacyl-tRNA deacylase [Bacteroidia bacterium]MDW8158802.1 D-aminoacyl-tRNA deacylase [Bacteroidia bacterium]